MERLKSILKKLFVLPPLPTVLIAIPCFIFVFIMLGIGDHSAFAYVSYILSAYAMIITITGLPGVLEAIRNGINSLALLKKIRGTALGGRLLGDAIFRSELTLHGGLLINLLYAALNLFSGIRYRSTWFVALAFYYALLSAMRAVLVRYVHRKPVGQDILAEFRRYRACGIILLLMNQALVGIIVYMVTQDRGFSYPGLLIYAMAMYAFYITISAIINVIKHRSHKSPVMSAAKAVSLTAALVSMLSLETAMLARFGSDETEFRRMMLGASGGIVCAFVLAMAIYMIVRSTKQLKKTQNNNLET
ncbi:MAG: hypothetical protein KHW59_07135 [Clostridiales bacterium]|nr:hypothetical protein [Clostridiales bacterium]